MQPPQAGSEAQPRQQAPYPPQQAFPQAPDAAPAPDTAVPDADALSGSVSERPSATTGTPPGPGPGTQARPQHGAAPEAAEHDSGQELESAVESATEFLAEFENKMAQTTEMSQEDVAQLRAAIAEDPEKGREIAGLDTRADPSEVPDLNLDDPQLSERDRALLRELHAELAERERAEAARTRTNGVQHRWSE